jgi:hypothetical protein
MRHANEPGFPGKPLSDTRRTVFPGLLQCLVDIRKDIWLSSNAIADESLTLFPSFTAQYTVPYRQAFLQA